jgi:hypothetical protein
MDRYEGHLTNLTTALHRTLLSHYNGHLKRTLTALTIALPRGHYLAIIMDRYRGPLSALTIALHRGIDLVIMMSRYE